MNAFLKKAKKTLIGNRAFYMTVLGILVPMVIQNGITNFVSLLDNLMVGALGDAEMSGVAIANQLVFVFNLCIFGGLSGAGIYTAQFFGAGDIKGVRDTFRIKIMLSAVLLTVVSMITVILAVRYINRLQAEKPFKEKEENRSHLLQVADELKAAQNGKESE